MIDYRKELNDEQYRAVTSADGPCLVLAGAGSGKTRTLVYRVAYLLEHGVAPENILLMTFTNKAAKEMLARVQQLLGVTPQQLVGGTFHSIGNKILRTYAEKLGYTRFFSILDQDDSVSLLKTILSEHNLKGVLFPKPSVVQAIISYAQNTRMPVLQVAQETYDYPDFVAVQIDEVAYHYREKKKLANAMDFDDLLTQWLVLLQEHPDVHQKLSSQFKYILVDEYQDTNVVQAAIVRELATVNKNVLVVGDDAQSIYSFRAADVNNILHFPDQFAGTQVYRIEMNYRSTPQILSLANDSIKHNQGRFEKKLQAAREDGLLPLLVPARDVYQQATMVTQRIQELQRRGAALHDIAVLFRATFHAAELQLELARQNIPYVVRGGMRYFEQAHIKDIVAYLKIVANYKDEIAWKRILRMYDGIGEKQAASLWQEIQKCDSLADVFIHPMPVKAARARGSWFQVVDIFKSIDMMRNQPGFMAAAVNLLMERSYEVYVRNSFDDYRDRLDDIHQFVNFVATYETIEGLLSDVMLSEQFSRTEAKTADAVILSTIHQAKGLEWPYVMVIGLRDGDFPHHKSFERASQLEEERRLFYVAVTRAKDELSLLFPVRKFSYQYGDATAGPSLFIRELDPSRYVEMRGSGIAEYDDNPAWEDEVISIDQ